MNVNDVAKKTMGRIAKAQEKLDALYAKRDEMTADYNSKMDAINSQIKEQEKEVATLNTKAQEEKLRAANRLLAKKGITADQLLLAIANGDLYGIQEIMENGGVAPAVSENVLEEINNDNTEAETENEAEFSADESSFASETSSDAQNAETSAEHDYNNYLGNGSY